MRTTPDRQDRPRLEEIRTRLRELNVSGHATSRTDVVEILAFLLMGVVVGVVLAMVLLILDRF